jgi:hypothetical protein
METLTLEARFNGPPASGNGGYVAGILAARLGARTVEVTLRAPPPLDVPLQLRALEGGGLSLHDGETLLAQAVESDAALARLRLPPLPALEQAEAAGAIGRMRARTLSGNPYDHCFGCGIAREDGLRLVPSPVGEDGVVAAAWTPLAGHALPDGAVSDAIVWAALDCPAGFAWSNRLPEAPPMMTGRIAATIDLPLRAGDTYVVAGWPIEQDGRKLHAGTAILGKDGRVQARSLQLWLLPRS